MAFILLPECDVIVNLVDFLCQVLCRWRFFAGAERGSRVSQCDLNGLCGRVRTSKHASRDPFRVLARRHGLAEIVKRRAVGFVERLRVNPPQPEREIVTLSENSLRRWHRFAHQCLGFFEALCLKKTPRVVVGC